MVLAENTTTGAVSTGHKVKETESRSQNLEFRRKAKKGTSTQETVLQFVIPAKSADGGREPGSRQRPREGGEPDIK